MGRNWIVLALYCSAINRALVAQNFTVLVPFYITTTYPEHAALDVVSVVLGTFGDPTSRTSDQTLAVATNDATGDINCYRPSSETALRENIDYWRVRRATVGNQQVAYITRGLGSTELIQESGIWRCELPDDSGNPTNVYFGLYYRGDVVNRGGLSTCPSIDFQASSLLTEPLTYTLTCNTTGGPPTDFNWTINGASFLNSISTRIVNDTIDGRMNSHYTNTLMVTGRQSGVIMFTASNTFTPGVSRDITITFPASPTNVQASPEVGIGQVNVTWDGLVDCVIIVNDQLPISAQSSPFTLTLDPGTYNISVASVMTLHGSLVYSERVAISRQVQILTVPGAVSSLTLVPKFRSIVVIWSKPDGIITQYAVIYTVGTVTTTNTTGNSATTFTIASLSPGTNVTVTVRAFNNIIAGESVTLIGSTLTAPSPIQNVQVENIDGSSVNVSWTFLDIPEITGYKVYYYLSRSSRKRQSVISGSIEVEGRETESAIVFGLTDGAVFDFRVVGVATVDGETVEGELVATQVVLHEVYDLTTAATTVSDTACTCTVPILVGSVVGTAFVTTVLSILLAVMVACFCLRKRQRYSTQGRGTIKHPEDSIKFDVGDSVENPANNKIELKENAAYGSGGRVGLHVEQHGSRNEGVYENPDINLPS